MLHMVVLNHLNKGKIGFVVSEGSGIIRHFPTTTQ